MSGDSKKLSERDGVYTRNKIYNLRKRMNTQIKMVGLCSEYSQDTSGRLHGKVGFPTSYKRSYFLLS